MTQSELCFIEIKNPQVHLQTYGSLLALQVGLEPTTLRLTAECSAIELLKHFAGYVSISCCGIRRRPILPGRCQPSTFSAVRLNFCVRYGYRWFPYAIVTGNLALPRLQNRTVDSGFTFFLSLRSSFRPISISKLECYHSFTADLSPHRL